MGLPQLRRTDAVILVDVQNDFCPGGALPVEKGDKIVQVCNRWIEAARDQGAWVVASRDWHPPDHASFRERGGKWPAHCVQDSWGAQFHPHLQLPDNVLIVSKGTDAARDEYSGFEMTGLARELRHHCVSRLWVGGLALEVCVRATVLDGLKAGFEVHLIRDATRPLNACPGDGNRAVQEMQAAGCIIHGGDDCA
jgi:nicotinamidase/pyrazinamidase